MDDTYIDGPNRPDVVALAMTDDEIIPFRRRGLSPSDVALGPAMLEKAEALGIGQRPRDA